MQTAVDWFPGFAAVVGAESPGSRYRNKKSRRIFWIDQDCVETDSARARLPLRAGVVLSEPREFAPRFAAVFRFEQRGIFHTCVNMIGAIKSRFRMPYPLKLPWMLGPIVPLVGARDPIVN